MKIIEAPNLYVPAKNEITCFLAGGITNCHQWQKSVINAIDSLDHDIDLVIYNPRRENFDITKDDSKEQIKWEFNYLEKCDIFSMYFASSEKSNQPICLYELGRNLVRMQTRFPSDYTSHGLTYLSRIVVTVESGYSRKDDVLIQTELATGPVEPVVMVHQTAPDAIQSHARRILNAYYKLKTVNPN